MPGTGNRPRFCFGSDRLEGETIGERIDFSIDDNLIREGRRLGEYKTAMEV